MDLAVINGNFITMNKNKPFVQAVGIKDNKFIKVGTNEEVLSLRKNDTKVIDLNGKTVTPGFNDSHIHLLNYAYGLTKVDCSDAKSIDEIIERGRKFIKENNIKPGEWVLGRGWNDVILKEQREITRYDLDKISTENPISFTRICEHITVANSKAMEVAGITKDTPQPLGGHFDVDEDGNPTGIFRENARYMIYDIIPDLEVEEIKGMLLDAAKIAVSYGVTSVQTDDFEALPGKD